MSRRVAILAALPRELEPLVSGWARCAAGKNVWLWAKVGDGGDQIVAACAGMGANAVRRAFAAAEERGPLDLVINVGLAGATDASMRVGEVSRVGEVVDVQTGERFPLASGEGRVRIATVTQTADAAEKKRLFASYGAVLVDMEAATVARLAAMRELPMCCFKAVSDPVDAELPEIDRFVDSEGQFSVPRFVAYLAVRPGKWPAVLQLARSSSHASKALASCLGDLLCRKDWQ